MRPAAGPATRYDTEGRGATQLSGRSGGCADGSSTRGIRSNVGIFYQIRITGGGLRPEPDGDTAGSAWIAVPEVAGLCRSSLVDVGLGLARTLPATGHVPPVAVGGLIRH